MGLLPRMFSKPQEENLSFVRSWALRQEKEAKYGRRSGFDLLFGAIVFAISDFGQVWINILEPNDIPAGKEKFRNKPFAGDSSLFEIACYAFSLIDYWFFNNRKDIRNDFNKLFYQNIIDLFEKALDQDEDYIKMLIDERYLKYSELLSKDENIERFHYYLIELLMRTKYNTRPNEVEFDYFEPEETGFYCDYPAMNISLSSFEMNIVPAMIRSIENFIQMVER